MSNAIYTALSGAVARERELDSISHNLANADTAGYQKRQQTFEEVLSGDDQSLRQTQIDELHLDQSEGDIKSTENPLDVAIRGKGFFELANSQGDRRLATRSGDFALDEGGQLVTSDGDTVLGEDGQPIRISPNTERLDIAEDGTVYTDNGAAGRLSVVTLEDTADIETVGDTKISAPEEAFADSERAEVKQGFIEESNVDPTQQMTDMIRVQRHFETMTKLLQTYDQIDQSALRKMG